MCRLLLTVFFLFFTQTATARIDIKIDRDLIVANEAFQLIFEADEKIDGEPDFSVLKNSFTILNNSRSSKTQIINGKISYSQQWRLTVMANQAGKITIPSIQFGTQRSPADKIEVVQQATNSAGTKSDKDIFFEVSVDEPEPYVQAQVRYTVKLYRSVSVSNASLTEPELTGGKAVINKVGDDQSYETQLNGKRYIVVSRQYVLFPQSSGRLTIEPLVLQAQTGRGSGAFSFDPFGPPAKTITVRSDKIGLQVKPVPAAFSGKIWLPARQINIEEQWSIEPDKLERGQTTTRSLTIRAEGLAASQLPVIKSDIPDTFKQYPDQPEFEESNTKNGYQGIRRDKMALILMQGGDFVLPAIRLPWWNTETDKMEIAELPERVIHVKATAMPPEEKETLVEKNISETANSKGQEITPDASTPIKDTVLNGHLFWKWISMALLLLWLFTLVLFWRSRYQKEKALPVKKDNADKSLKQFKLACRNHDPNAAKEALLAWANSVLSDKTINNLADLQNFGNAEFNQQLVLLNRHLYSQQSTHWDGTDLLRTLPKKIFTQNVVNSDSGKLEPLYKT